MVIAPHVAIHNKKPAATTPTARANHLSCWRRGPAELRKRTTKEAADANIVGRSKSQPTAPSSRMLPFRPSIPTGLKTFAPGARRA